MKKKVRDGFTLVELSFSMVFIGILSLAIVLIINNTITAYQRGLTLNRINTTGSDLIDELRSSVEKSSARSLLSSCGMVLYAGGKTMSDADIETCKNSNAMDFVSVTGKAKKNDHKR